MAKISKIDILSLKKSGLLLTICYFLALSLLFLHPVNSGDFFHNLNAARFIVENHHLPRVDNLTFTAYEKPWVAHSWGSGLIYFFLVKFFGFWAISIFFAFVGLATSFFLFQTLKHLKAPAYTGYALTLVAASIAAFRWESRPETMATFFSVILVYILIVKRNYIHILPLVFFFWSIAYGASTLFGVLVFLLWTVATKAQSAKTLIVFLLSILAVLLNGFGPSSLFYFLQIKSIGQNIGEWFPLIATVYKAPTAVFKFYKYPVASYLVFILVFVTSLATVVRKKPKVIKNNLFLFALSTTIFAPFLSNKFLALSTFCTIPALALLLQNLSPKIQRIVLVLLILTSFIATIARFKYVDFGTGLSELIFPTKIVDYMKANNIAGNIFSSQEIGAYLSWSLPSSKVFVDTRDDLFTKTDVFGDLKKLSYGEINILQIVDKYGADIIVGHVTPELYRPILHTNNWKIIFIKDNYFVAKKH